MAVSTRISDTTATLVVEGRFDFNSHADFKTAGDTVFSNKNVRSIEINMARVDYVDSSALGILLVLRDRATAAGVTNQALVGATGLVKQILTIAHFEKFFTLR